MVASTAAGTNEQLCRHKAATKAGATVLSANELQRRKAAPQAAKSAKHRLRQPQPQTLISVEEVNRAVDRQVDVGLVDNDQRAPLQYSQL